LVLAHAPRVAAQREACIGVPELHLWPRASGTDLLELHLDAAGDGGRRAAESTDARAAELFPRSRHASLLSAASMTKTQAASP
jgi:hypothetical protein